MRPKGYILLALLLVLLFLAVLLLQLKEDNYFAQLMAKHLDALMDARNVLQDAFLKLSSSSEKNAYCFVDTNDRSELKRFWNEHSSSCHISIVGTPVNYAFRHYQQAEQKTSYLQYTLQAQSRFGALYLRVVQEDAGGLITAWQYTIN